jgi:glycosyltransferase involved in cell wall biosynthesis
MTQPTGDDCCACDLTLFIACYNEQEGILPTIETVLAAVNEVGCSYDIVIIDDASTDNSVPILREYMAQHSEIPITLIVNKVNQGLGANYVEAAFRGRGKYYRLVCGDDVETKETLAEVFRHLGEADMILTYHADTRVRPLARRIISRSYTLLVNLLGGHRIKYYNGVAVHLRYNVMRWHSNSHGFGFQADLVDRLLSMGATYIEIPVFPKERASGATKAFTLRNIASVSHTFLEVVIRRIARILYPNLSTRLTHGAVVFATPAVQNLANREVPEANR